MSGDEGDLAICLEYLTSLLVGSLTQNPEDVGRGSFKKWATRPAEWTRRWIKLHSLHARITGSSYHFSLFLFLSLWLSATTFPLSLPIRIPSNPKDNFNCSSPWWFSASGINRVKLNSVYLSEMPSSFIYFLLVLHPKRLLFFPFL